jgi:hypothetical protein
MSRACRDPLGWPRLGTGRGHDDGQLSDGRVRGSGRPHPERPQQPVQRRVQRPQCQRKVGGDIALPTSHHCALVACQSAPPFKCVVPVSTCAACSDSEDGGKSGRSDAGGEPSNVTTPLVPRLPAAVAAVPPSSRTHFALVHTHPVMCFRFLLCGSGDRGSGGQGWGRCWSGRL